MDVFYLRLELSTTLVPAHVDTCRDRMDCRRTLPAPDGGFAPGAFIPGIGGGGGGPPAPRPIGGMGGGGGGGPGMVSCVLSCCGGGGPALSL